MSLVGGILKMHVKTVSNEKFDLILALNYVDAILSGFAYIKQSDKSLILKEGASLRGSKIEFILSDNAQFTLQFKVMLDADGDYFSGNFFQVDGVRGLVEGKRNLSSKAVSLFREKCPDENVDAIIDKFWTVWQCGDYNSWTKMWVPTVIQQGNYDRNAFQKDQTEYDTKGGDYIVSHFIQKVHMPQLGGYRYDYDVDFIKQKKWKHYFIFDSNGLIVAADDKFEPLEKL